MLFVNLFDRLLNYHKDLKNATNKMWNEYWIILDGCWVALLVSPGATL
jgi:hypothetical protein